MQTCLDSKHLADEKMLDLQFQNFVNLPLSSEAETGTGGDQPVRNSLADRNDKGAETGPFTTNHFESSMP